MAWTTLCYGKQDMPFNYCEFICDSKDDISDLPTNKHKSNLGQIKLTCAIGSKATVIEDGSTYILNNQNNWTYYEKDSSGSEIQFPDVETASPEDIDALF